MKLRNRVRMKGNREIKTVVSSEKIVYLVFSSVERNIYLLDSGTKKFKII